MFPLKTSTSGLCLLLVFAVLSPGCQALHIGKLHRIPSASAEHPVVEVVCDWEPAEGNDSEGRPCRGFSGLLTFFALGETAPVRIDGKIHIYVFDDQGTPEEQHEPIHQFDFDSESFQGFLTETDHGAAYQLFIPYTREGSHRATCTLRVRLTPEEGSRVYSKMGTVLLPGTSIGLDDVPIGQLKAEPNQQSDSLSANTAVTETTNVPNSNVAPVHEAPPVPNESFQPDNRLRRSQLTEIANVAAAPADEPTTDSHPNPSETGVNTENRPAATQADPFAADAHRIGTWEVSTPQTTMQPAQNFPLNESLPQDETVYP